MTERNQNSRANRSPNLVNGELEQPPFDWRLRSVSHWVTDRYRTLCLPDARLEKRLLRISSTLASQPMHSINRCCESWADAKATYRFIENEAIDEESMKNPVCEATVKDCEGRRCVLAIQDTTVLSFQSARQAEGLGPVNDHSKGRGMFLHPTLAVDMNGPPLGLLDWRTWTRPLAQPNSKPHYSKRQMSEKESGKWLDGMEAARDVLRRRAPEEKRPRLIHVFDREGDIHEVFENIAGSPDGAVIRCNHNRRVLKEDGLGALAHDAVAEAPVLGSAEIEVPRKHGQKKRSALIEMRSRRLTLPAQGKSEAKSPGIHLTLLELVEPDPPSDSKPLRWLLWTTEPVEAFDEAMGVVEIYKKRWKIEELFLVLKSGCRIESAQFETAERLAKLVALYAPVALRILQLRDLSRHEPNASCESVLSEEEWKTLWTYIHKRRPPSGLPPPTIRQVTLYIGKLGGHLGRKSDGMPGVRALWAGWNDLARLTQLYQSLQS